MSEATAPRLLVVDDEPELLAEIATYLRRRGELVVTAASYKEAADILSDKSQKIDLLITDGRMPDGSGIDLIRSVIGRPETCCPCILMTGHVENSEGVDDLNASGVKFLYKPFALAAFYRKVRSAIDHAVRSAERLQAVSASEDARPVEAGQNPS
jgi:two-component system, NtrC family, response regulator PilR